LAHGENLGHITQKLRFATVGQNYPKFSSTCYPKPLVWIPRKIPTIIIITHYGPISQIWLSWTTLWASTGISFFTVQFKSLVPIQRVLQDDSKRYSWRPSLITTIVSKGFNIKVQYWPSEWPETIFSNFSNSTHKLLEKNIPEDLI
jgi:hypothetical protein